MYKRVMQKLAGTDAQCYLIKNEANKNWLCSKGNYFLPGALLVTPTEVFLATPSRNYAAFKKMYADYTVIAGGIQKLFEVIKDKGFTQLGIESNHISLDEYKMYSEQLPRVNFIHMPDFIEDLRMIKTDDEIRLVAEAVKLSDSAFVEFLNYLKVGQTEKEARDLFHSILLKKGAEGLCFDLLLSSGAQCFLPHAASTGKVIQKGDFVLMDFGIILNGYCSDTTRTVVMGEATDEQKRIYNLVRKAQENALNNIREGVTLREADAFARDVIMAEQDKGCFDYGLGHGIGMLVHEKPRMHPANTDVMKAGTIVSVEPGIYIEGFGGVRIEDLLLVQEDKPGRNLTSAPKDLMIL